MVPFIRAAKRILDIGCGVFVWNETLTSDQLYLGLDIEDEVVGHNREHFDQYEFAAFDANQSDYGAIPDGFDLIIMLASIEHIANPQRVLTELKPKLVPGGKLVLTTPAPWGDFILDTGAKFGIFASDKHQHEELLGKKDLTELGSKSGLSISLFKRFLYFQNQLAVFENRA